MRTHGTEASAGRKAGLWLPVAANLGLGIPAIVPLYLTWWLVTEYLPMDCRSVADLAEPDLANCGYHTLDHAPIVMLALAVTGLFGLAAVVVIDVVLPLRHGLRLSWWLGAAVLIPAPFLVGLALS
ncbi:unnamed protein product [[Actinomadura] parvosata subsp. kistnae]|uniref:Uncharacterized protein n=1 Tax=[Actinomadura] parvosata subsp. kistnae TaxID=1909395 RepID=A0A1V0AHQ9_9ACTN|nr:hypothetical protein [Nonomuraea sp. ATCC 55076]AQZ69746.1 hypothetical protein BKM31_57175 [Nonomuraea sp. ATCC 55076]SPL91526.1 unnamed protein product [Actinomadura parvosata subsp. kistnae]